jgi:hypothetical protein
MRPAAGALGIVAALAAGCAEPVHLLDRGGGGGTAPCSFWPPPPPTSTLTGDLAATATFGQAADRVATALRDAGYAEQQWYPVGAHYLHGFAVTTRLERIDEVGRPRSPSDRWSSLYPEASTLRWLERAHTMPLPLPGRYRVLLLAFTDLPIGETGRAAAWNQQTLMEAPDTPPQLPALRRASSRFRLAFFVYEYERARGDAKGAFVPEATLSAAVHVQASGLSALIGGTR